jgi:hypothetical protein
MKQSRRYRPTANPYLHLCRALGLSQSQFVVKRQGQPPLTASNSPIINTRMDFGSLAVSAVSSRRLLPITIIRPTPHWRLAAAQDLETTLERLSGANPVAAKYHRRRLVDLVIV